MKNLLFIPSYQCARQIKRVLESLTSYTQYFHEILVIDNQSPDETFEVAKETVNHLKLPIKILKNPANVGLGGTHKMCFQYAIENKFDHVVILHGDDQGSIRDFESILKEACERKFLSFQFGSRFHTDSQRTNYGLIRTWGNQFFNTLASFISHRSISDLGGSGLNLFPVSLLEKHQFLRYSNDLTFHVYVLLNALRLGQAIEFRAISWREEDQMSNVRMYRQTKKLISILITYLTKNRCLLSDSSDVFSYHPRQWES